MLSYKHGFHAGNHTDVLKHLVLMLVLNYTKQKDKPFLYIDTHAGSSVYDLTAADAKKNAEYHTGIKKIWDYFSTNTESLDHAKELFDYLALVKTYNQEHKLVTYPGSPAIAIDLLREQDRIALFELHTTEYNKLTVRYAGYKKLAIAKSDGLHGLSALLPPLEKRAVVLIDPSYEVKTDYLELIASMREAYNRFTSGVYMIWYPITAAGYAFNLPKDLLKIGFDKMLQTELHVSLPNTSSTLAGSGMLIVNPPYVLQSQLQNLLPYVQKAMSPVVTKHRIQCFGDC